MKIAIIGGGWVGCHLAYKLKKEHDVKIYEKNNELFKETSFKNQNRLHYGFHYARNNRTRELCKNTFYKFIKDYGFLTKEIKTNLYCVPKKNSIVDYDTYIKIFHDFDYEKSELKFSNIDGCIKTKERHINFIDVSNFFNVELKNNVITQNVDASILKQLKNEYDFVINATNNFIKDETINDSFYELTITFLYEKINETNFDAITLVDGDFFSIYPYEKNIFTVTDVEYTPLKKFKTVSDIENYKKRIDIAFVNERRKLIEEKILSKWD